MELGLGGRTAFVGGSTAGLGAAIARALSHEGVQVAVTGRRGELARSLASELQGAIGLEVDLADPNSVEAAVTTTEQALGHIDILVINGGGPPVGAATDVTGEVVGGALETLLLRPLQLVGRVLPQMRSRGWGRILAVGSSGVREPLSNMVLSNVGRGALAAYLKTLAAEVAADGVTVNMILPGRIDTDRVTQLDTLRAQREGTEVAAVRRRSEQSIPMRRYGSPPEFAAVACFLCSAAASYVTGEQVRVDGGQARGY